MSRETTAEDIPRCRGSFLLVLAGALIAAFAPALFPQDVQMGWSTDSETLVLAEVKQSGASTIFVLRNNSEKPITAVSICYGDTTRGIEYFQSNKILNPRATCSIHAGSHEFSGIDRVLRVCAAVFADGTWEGSQAEVVFLGARRLGRVTEVERVKGILDALPEQELGGTEIAALKARIGALPDSPEEALDSVADVSLPGLDINSIRSANERLQRGFMIGVHSVRNGALSQMDKLAQLPWPAAGARQKSGVRFISELREVYQVMSAQNHELLMQKPEYLPTPRERNER